MAPPSPASAPVADYVAAQRRPVALALLAVGTVALAVAAICFSRAVSSAGAKADEAASGALNPFQSEYILGGLAGLAAAAVGFGLGGTLLAKLPPLAEEARRREARTTLLLAGGMIGLAAVLLGIGLFAVWYGALVKWVGNADPSQAWKPLTALLVLLAGGGLALLAAQPARAAERDDPVIRRVCYGVNFALSTLLVVVGLVVVNILVSLELPARLDAGRYTLDKETKEYLSGLSQDVTAYTVLADDDREDGRAVHRLLAACREANPARFKVVTLSRTLNKTDIADLKAKFKAADVSREPGVLVAVGASDPQYSFVPVRDMVSERGFGGEAKLVNEVQFLAEKKVRPVIYFTQGSGELQLDRGGPNGPPARTASALAAALGRIYADVRPLKIDAQTPDVPADATLVVVADPLGPLAKPTLDALKAYTAEKKGRLIVLSGPMPGPPNGTPRPTNLGELLAPFGVALGDRFLYSEPIGEDLPGDLLSVVPAPDMAQARNPVAVAAGTELRVPLFARELRIGAAAGKTVPVLVTLDRRPTWVLPQAVETPEALWVEILRALSVKQRAAAVVAQFDVGNKARTVAALASDADGTPRAAVFGYGLAFDDNMRNEPRQYSATQTAHLETLVGAVNWLRERPAGSTAAAKDFGLYKPARELTPSLAIYLPVGGLLLVVAFLGLGVWSYRRK